MMIVLSYLLMNVGWAIVAALLAAADNSERKLLGIGVGVMFFVLGTIAMRRNDRPPASKRRIVGWLMIPSGIVCGVCFAVFLIENVLKNHTSAYAGLLAMSLTYFFVGVCLVDGRLFALDD